MWFLYIDMSHVPGPGLGIRVTSPAELDAALTRALAHDGPATVEVMADADLI